jgi:nucleoside phosphorylase
MKRIAIIAAMAGELKPLVRGWRQERRNGVEVWTRRFDDREWIAASAGAGQQAATRAFAAIEQSGPVDAAVSIGWVGALDDKFMPGQVYRASGVIDQQTGERFRTGVASEEEVLKGYGFSLDEAAFLLIRQENSGIFFPPFPAKSARKDGAPSQYLVAGSIISTCSGSQGLKPGAVREADCGTAEAVPFQSKGKSIWLVTSPRVADEAEKQRLAPAYGAGLVDMEAAAVARLAAMRGIPFYAIKGVSDGFRDKLPDFNRFLGPKGEFQLIRLILFVLPRPWVWPSLVRMGENSKKASQSIALDLLELLNLLDE